MTSAPSLAMWITIGRFLGDHLWQSTLFAALAALLTLAFRNHHAQVRYGLWLAASVKFLIPFAALVALGGHFGWRTAPLSAHAPVTIAMNTMSQPFSHLVAAPPQATTSPSMASRFWFPLFAIWFCGCAAILLNWCMHWRRIRAAVRKASPLHVDGPIKVLSSPARLEPGIFGIVRPVLLLPEGVTHHLTQAQLQAILAHELSHVRRRDNLAAAVHTFVEALFWFHPLVWWLGARMIDERERACDEEVLRLGGEPQVYAEGILKVCELHLEPPAVCVAAVTGADLTKRIERIMKNRAGETLTGWRRFFLATAGVAALAVPVVAGVMTAPRHSSRSSAAGSQPAFDAASVLANSSRTTSGTLSMAQLPVTAATLGATDNSGDTNLSGASAQPVSQVTAIADGGPNRVPNHLPDGNPWLNEFPDNHHIPRAAAMGGADTMYPDYKATLNAETAPSPKPKKKASGDRR